MINLFLTSIQLLYGFGTPSTTEMPDIPPLITALNPRCTSQGLEPHSPQAYTPHVHEYFLSVMAFFPISRFYRRRLRATLLINSFKFTASILYAEATVLATSVSVRHGTPPYPVALHGRAQLCSSFWCVRDFRSRTRRLQRASIHFSVVTSLSQTFSVSDGSWERRCCFPVFYAVKHPDECRLNVSSL